MSEHSGDSSGRGWMEYPLMPRVVSRPPQYDNMTDGPITAYEIVNDGVVLGYLWASHDDVAASFEDRQVGGIDADKVDNAAIAWFAELRKAKSSGLGARAALNTMAISSGPDGAGRLVAGSRRDMSSVAELQALARS